MKEEGYLTKVKEFKISDVLNTKINNLFVTY